MLRTITLDVMWQLDTLTGNAVTPDEHYEYGSANCFLGGSTMCLVETSPERFAGHIDFDRSAGDYQHAGVYIGEPEVVAQEMLQTFSHLNATRKDGLGVEQQPAHIVVWLREFKGTGGPEIVAVQLLEWKNPAIR